MDPRYLTFSPTNALHLFQILPPNPLRAEIIFSNASTSYFSVTTNPAGESTEGLVIQPTGGLLVLKFRDEGAWVQMAWYATMYTMGGTLTVLTLDYHEDW